MMKLSKLAKQDIELDTKSMFPVNEPLGALPNYSVHGLRSALEIIDGMQGRRNRVKTLQNVVITDVISNVRYTRVLTNVTSKEVLPERAKLLC